MAWEYHGTASCPSVPRTARDRKSLSHGRSIHSSPAPCRHSAYPAPATTSAQTASWPSRRLFSLARPLISARRSRPVEGRGRTISSPSRCLAISALAPKSRARQGSSGAVLDTTRAGRAPSRSSRSGLPSSRHPWMETAEKGHYVDYSPPADHRSTPGRRPGGPREVSASRRRSLHATDERMVAARHIWSGS